MGSTKEQLPPSEALPGIGEYPVVFHNGTGFYYICREYSPELNKRLFECVRPECRVTARMGEGCGSPLINSGSHSHPSDLNYREKCLVLHNIRWRLTLQEIPTSEILRDALSSLQVDSGDYVTASSPTYKYETCAEPSAGELPLINIKVEETVSLGDESEKDEILSELSDCEEHTAQVFLPTTEPFTTLFLPEENMLERADVEKKHLPEEVQAIEEIEDCYLPSRRAMRREIKRENLRKAQTQTLARKKDTNHTNKKETSEKTERVKRYRQYTAEDLGSAISAVRAGIMRQYSASKHFGVPLTTLRDQLKKRRKCRSLERQASIQEKKVMRGYSINNMREAITAVQSGSCTIYAAAEKFGVPSSTLRMNLFDSSKCSRIKKGGGARVKKVKKLYSFHELRQAVKAVEEGSTYADAARKFGLPQSTLRDQCRKQPKVRSGITPTYQEEKTIIEKLESISQEGFPISRLQLVSIAINTINSRSGGSSPPLITKSSKLDFWLAKFLSTHPDIEKKLSKAPVTEDELVNWLRDDENKY